MQEQLEAALEGAPTGAEAVLSSLRGHRQAAAATSAPADVAVAIVADSGVREAFSGTDQPLHAAGPLQQHSGCDTAAVDGHHTSLAASSFREGGQHHRSAAAGCSCVIDTGHSAQTQPPWGPDTASSAEGIAEGMTAGNTDLSQKQSSISARTSPSSGTLGVSPGHQAVEDADDADNGSADDRPAMRRLERQLSKVQGCGRRLPVRSARHIIRCAPSGGCQPRVSQP